MNDYIAALIAERRVRPGDDLLSALIAAEESGDRLSPDELVAMVVQLLYAGHETTRNLIGNGLFCLLEHPAELARLRARAGARGRARSRRCCATSRRSSSSRASRCADVEVGGVEFAKGELLHLSLASANRDADAFASPSASTSARADNRHVTFGFGAHFCIGAAIARMEARVAFETLLRALRAHRARRRDAALGRGHALRSCVHAGDRLPVRLRRPSGPHEARAAQRPRAALRQVVSGYETFHSAEPFPCEWGGVLPEILAGLRDLGDALAARATTRSCCTRGSRPRRTRRATRAIRATAGGSASSARARRSTPTATS